MKTIFHLILYIRYLYFMYIKKKQNLARNDSYKKDNFSIPSLTIEPNCPNALSKILSKTKLYLIVIPNTSSNYNSIIYSLQFWLIAFTLPSQLWPCLIKKFFWKLLNYFAYVVSMRGRWPVTRDETASRKNTHSVIRSNASP